MISKEAVRSPKPGTYREHGIVANPLFTAVDGFAFLRQEPRLIDLGGKLGLDTFQVD